MARGPALADATALAAYLNRDVSSIGTDRADLLLELASDIVRDEIDQRIDLVEDDDVTLTGNGTEVLLLPELPVEEVTAVEETINGETTTLVEDDDFTLDLGHDGRVGTIYRKPRSAIWRPDATILVTYTHGYALGDGSDTPSELPGTILAAVLRCAARGAANPSGLRQETIGRYGYTAGGNDAGLYLTAGDKRDLDPYRPGNRGGSK